MSNDQIKLQILGSIAQSLENISSILADIQFQDSQDEDLVKSDAPVGQPYSPHGPDAEPEYPATISGLPTEFLNFLNGIRASEAGAQGSPMSSLERMMGL